MKDITTEENLYCPIRYFLDIAGGKWKLPIICMLADGKPSRYGVIKRKLTDVTNMMLAQSLKELEAAGMVHREQYNEVPPRVEYTLTDKGKGILPGLKKLAEWTMGNMQEDIACGVFCDTCRSTR
jgi:DNA-binding HxlR family transcriptional regulator